MSKINLILIGVAFLSFTALGIAFASEAILGLEPCRLCIYQRWPFALGILLGLVGFFLSYKRIILGITSINFFVNSSIAFYHTGVEQKWWVSHFEGCAVFFPEDTKEQSFFENLMSTPMARCDEIPWQDPIFGFSMANYNILLCFGIGLICLTSIFYVKPESDLEDHSSESSVSQ